MFRKSNHGAWESAYCNFPHQSGCPQPPAALALVLRPSAVREQQCQGPPGWARNRGSLGLLCGAAALRQPGYQGRVLLDLHRRGGRRPLFTAEETEAQSVKGLAPDHPAGRQGSLFEPRVSDASTLVANPSPALCPSGRENSSAQTQADGKPCGEGRKGQSGWERGAALPAETSL